MRCTGQVFELLCSPPFFENWARPEQLMKWPTENQDAVMQDLNNNYCSTSSIRKKKSHCHGKINNSTTVVLIPDRFFLKESPIPALQLLLLPEGCKMAGNRRKIGRKWPMSVAFCRKLGICGQSYVLRNYPFFFLCRWELFHWSGSPKSFISYVLWDFFPESSKYSILEVEKSLGFSQFSIAIFGHFQAKSWHQYKSTLGPFHNGYYMHVLFSKNFVK